MYNTISFTEKAFLNLYYLKYLNPSECEEQQIQKPSKSVMDTLDTLEFNPYSNVYKGARHQWMKPVRVVARMAYTVFISVIVAPAGVVYHSALSLKNLGEYAIKKLFTKDQTFAQSLERAEKHGNCFSTDLWSTVQGTAVTIFCVCGPIFILLLSLELGGADFGTAFFTITPLMLIILSPFVLGGFYPQNFIPGLVADADKRIGMYISLKLRNDLGLVGPDGNILPFNSDDNVRILEGTSETPGYYTIYFKDNDMKGVSKTVTKLANFIFYAEFDLIHHIREANQLANQRGLKQIPFEYPFNSNKVATELENQFKKGMLQKEKSVIDSIKLSGRKIQILRELLKNVCEIAVNGGHAELVQRAIAQKKDYKHKLPLSFINLNDYTQYFQQGFSVSAETHITDDWKGFLMQLNNINVVDPKKEAFNPMASVYDKFKYKVGVAKFQAINQLEMASLHELLFLEKEYTRNELKKQWRHISVRIHPDHHHNSDEAKELFQALKIASDLLEKELKV